MALTTFVATRMLTVMVILLVIKNTTIKSAAIIRAWKPRVLAMERLWWS